MQSIPSTSRASAKAVVAALGVALLASMPVAAKQSDRDKPADVTSKSFDGTQAPQNGQPGKVIWTTNVVLTQGTLKITGSIPVGKSPHGVFILKAPAAPLRAAAND